MTSTAYFSDNFKEKARLNQGEILVDGVRVIALDVAYSHHMRFGRRIFSFLEFYFRATKVLKNEILKPHPQKKESLNQKKTTIGHSEGERYFTGIDLIYASSTPPTIGEIARKLNKSHAIPFVFETVDVWPDVPIGMGIISNPWLVKWLYSKVDCIYREATIIVALSEGMRAQVLKCGIAPEKVIVSHNGVDPEAFSFKIRKKSPGKPVEVIYAGTVGIANGLEQVLKAAKWIEEQGRTDIHFTIIGEGNDLQRVKRIASTLNLSILKFRKSVPKEEISAILEKADIGLVCFAPFPVLEANSANKFYDYLASGLPVILNYQGWQAEYLQKYAAGLFSRQGDSIAFARNILSLADDPEKRKQMAINGRKLVEKHFDRRQIATDLLEHFQEILEKQPL